MSDEDAETLYSIFEDKNADFIVDKIPGSDVLAFLSEAKEINMTKSTFEEQFLNYFGEYIDFGNDNDIKRKIDYIYNKYVR